MKLFVQEYDSSDMSKFKHHSNFMNKRYFKGLQKRNNIQHDEIECKINKAEECVLNLQKIMPIAISRYYVQKYFDDNIKIKVKEMFENIEEAMIDRIPKIEWLDDEIKEYGIQKVLSMKNIIGYTDDIMNPKKLYQYYKNLEINNYFDF